MNWKDLDGSVSRAAEPASDPAIENTLSRSSLLR